MRTIACLFLFLWFNSLPGILNAQNNSFAVSIIDNASIYNNRIEYHVTCDSLIINGLGDFGRTPVKYLQRELTRKECRSVQKFLHTFPIDSLDDLYNNEFNPVDYDNKPFFPRIMEISISTKGKSHYYQTRNCWVRYSDNLFNIINPLLPAEVKIKYDKAEFNAFY